MCLSLRAKVLFTSWLHVVCADLLLCHAILAPSAARDSIHIAQFVDERSKNQQFNRRSLPFWLGTNILFELHVFVPVPIILIVAAIWAVVSGLLLWGTYGVSDIWVRANLSMVFANIKLCVSCVPATLSLAFAMAGLHGLPHAGQISRSRNAA